jgi:hypothetical protein
MMKFDNEISKIIGTFDGVFDEYKTSYKNFQQLDNKLDSIHAKMQKACEPLRRKIQKQLLNRLVKYKTSIVCTTVDKTINYRDYSVRTYIKFDVNADTFLGRDDKKGSIFQFSLTVYDPTSEKIQVAIEKIVTMVEAMETV